MSDDDVYRCIVEDRMGDITDKESNVLKNYQYISNRLNKLLLQGYDANAILMALAMLICAINTYMIRRSLCDMNSQNISKLFPTVLKNVLDKCNDDYTDVLRH